jgi:hypothetical protein
MKAEKLSDAAIRAFKNSYLALVRRACAVGGERRLVDRSVEWFD